MKCSYKGCPKPVFVKKTPIGGLCNGHYAQFRKGKPLSPLRSYNPRRVPDTHSVCPVPGCKRPSWYSQGYCQSHYRQRSDGSEVSEIRNYEFQMGKTCRVPGCTKPAKSKGHCSTHYRSDWGSCKYPGCTRRMYNKTTGFCATHYNKHRRLVKKGSSLMSGGSND